MNVLIACEFSGNVRDAFIKNGHNAISCDLLETESPGPHIIGDVLGLLKYKWDLIIAHPPCTFIANSGVRWLFDKEGKENKERFKNMKSGALFFNRIMNANCDRIVVENPIPHSHAMRIIKKKYNQIIHPWQHGHGETKATCLWTKNVPNLVPSDIVKGRLARVHREPPGADRWKNRSRTYAGIAKAMADQWGILQ
jgi:hypothetical protein